jgi:hypothetical protein
MVQLFSPLREIAAEISAVVMKLLAHLQLTEPAIHAGREGLPSSRLEVPDQIRGGDQGIFLTGRNDGVCIEVAVERWRVFASFGLFGSEIHMPIGPIK